MIWIKSFLPSNYLIFSYLLIRNSQLWVSTFFVLSLVTIVSNNYHFRSNMPNTQTFMLLHHSMDLASVSGGRSLLWRRWGKENIIFYPPLSIADKSRYPPLKKSLQLEIQFDVIVAPHTCPWGSYRHCIHREFVWICLNLILLFW